VARASRSHKLIVRRHRAAPHRSTAGEASPASGDRARHVPDHVIVEEPMEIRLDGLPVATTMRTPGHDFELAVGLCVSEGLISADMPLGIRYCATDSAAKSEFNVVTVDTGGRGRRPHERLGTVPSSCGVCGTDSVDRLTARLRPIGADWSLSSSVVHSLGERIHRHQELFALTGGVHGAGAFDPDGEPVVVREDIGRHNAVDKVVGRLRLDGRTPASSMGLFVSGRASFEMVQKAWAAGFGAVVAVSAPSSLAVETARRAGITLVGFVREEGFNVYSGEVDG